MLYPKTLNVTIYRGSTYDMVVRFKAAANLLDVSGYTFIAYYYNADKEEILRAFIDRPSTQSIEIYLSREQTLQFLSNGTWKLAMTLPNSDRTYYILNGKVTVRS